MMKEHLHTPKDQKTVQRLIEDYYNQTKKGETLTKEDSECTFSGVKKKLSCRYTPLSPYTQNASIVEDKFPRRKSLTTTTHVTPCTPDEFLENSKNRTPLSPLAGNTLRDTSRGKLIENNAHCKPKQWSKENWYAHNSNIKQPVFHLYGSGSVPQSSAQGKTKLLKRKSTTNTSTKKGKSTANNIPPPSEDSFKAKRNRMLQYPAPFKESKGPPLDIRRRTNPPTPTYIPPTPHQENYMTVTSNYRNETRNKGKKAIEYTSDTPYSLNLISDFETDDIDDNDVFSDNEFYDDINLEWNELQKNDGIGKQPTDIVPRTLDFNENERQGNTTDYQPDIHMLSDQSDGDSEEEAIHTLLKSIGKSLKDYSQMPQPPNSYLDCSVNNLIIEETSYDIGEMEKEYLTLISSCNREQLEIYSAVMKSVEKKEGDIGDGKIPAHHNSREDSSEDDISIPPMFCNLDSGNSVEKMIESTFPNLKENFQKQAYLSERAILTPTNQTVGNVNSIIVDNIPGEISSYFSIDTAEDYPGTERDQLASFPPEYLNSISIPGSATNSNRKEDLKGLDDSTEEWRLRVRAQAIWKGITRQTGEFRGYNIIFIDDYNSRIHAFITQPIVPQFEHKLLEGQIYKIQNFQVRKYNGDETSRAVRNDQHIYFTSDTIFEKDTLPGLKIPDYSFDFYNLDELDAMKNDNRFLTDVVGVIEQVQPKSVYVKDTGTKSHVVVTISDGRTTINVTFFNEFGDSFLEQYEKVQQKPIILVVASGKASEWKEVLYVTNFPTTRFYLNIPHPAVNRMRKRHGKQDFYVMDIDDEDDPSNFPIMKVNELRKLNESYVQKKVACEVTVKKFDEKMNWYTPFCIKCEKELKLVNEIYQCCGRTYPYPDIRFRLYGLCSDDTGSIAIVWSDDEITRLTGKSVYDVEAEETKVIGLKRIPEILKSFEKKKYNITIILSEDNLKEGSKVYTASNISKPLEVSDSNTPIKEKKLPDGQSKLNDSVTMDIQTLGSSPPTGNSSNRSRPRVQVEPLGIGLEGSIKTPNFKNIKLEKVSVVFKGWNLLLLDNKNCRMHTFVPPTLAEKFCRIIEEGKIYLIKNFQVKDYTEIDKYRPVQMDRQIIFTADTKVKELAESEIFIPANNFDLFEYGDLKAMTTQQLYLTDVIGIIENIPKAIKDELEQPLILIIASGKISTWKEQLDMCNYSPTRFYLNSDHHSVTKLRKMLKDPNFSNYKFVTTKKPTQLFSISEIKNLTMDYDQDEVLCKAKIKFVEETTNWKRHICTSCYRQTELQENNYKCIHCNKLVAQPLTRFHVSTVAQDETGGIEIVLKDRQVRKLPQQTVEEVETEDKTFPKEIKNLQGNEYTIKLAITRDNIEKKDFDYVATDIFPRF
ncbi:hypothetical protein POM88_051529 [Heracleum sosnowskyi]|uniref:Replication protein A 70 kDa DNA-binding subunit B/D first OB fold domain-containing protein n=1 Tax=Heracleum sosnowskyi TaxID=360622 RepID=A0AAD8H220_9APIA|nr:hypothetical protein POM88_051529 [Heracleum sosnowskyi]